MRLWMTLTESFTLDLSCMYHKCNNSGVGAFIPVGTETNKHWEVFLFYGFMLRASNSAFMYRCSLQYLRFEVSTLDVDIDLLLSEATSAADTRDVSYLLFP